MSRALFPADERRLDDGWLIALCEPNTTTLDTSDLLEWRPAIVPGTVATNLDIPNTSGFATPTDMDAHEYWYRCTFASESRSATLVFDGLATLADVWLNGEPVLSSNNMFLSYQVFVQLAAENVLIIRFRSLNEHLSTKRQRAKWRTQLVSHRNLRFVRTTLLGRMPGVTPLIAPVGPWRSIRLLASDRPILSTRKIKPSLKADGSGEIDIDLLLEGTCTSVATAQVVLGDQRSTLHVSDNGKELRLTGKVSIVDPQLWWPHTHGEPNRYPLMISVQIGGATAEIPLPDVGFRNIALSGDRNDFEICVNGRSLHCRGACWMPMDLRSLRTEKQPLREVLSRCRSAGMNMLRVSGITLYESGDFYELCDELGILVWQDFMFARMDYPIAEQEFRDCITKEARSFLEIIGHRPCFAVLCGGSEIRQQAGMLGLPETIADSDWFDRQLPAICDEYRTDLIYCPHSPFGGALSFHGYQGVSHYFAVGGYRFPVIVAELDPPRFASECLAFSIPPEDAALAQFSSPESGFDWARFERSVPKDNGADWDFSDITDYYIGEHFSVNPTDLRTKNPSLYLAAGRIAVGETMKRSVTAWRRNGFTSGVLIWTLKDLAPGPGWGVLDSTGLPKAPYYFLKRAWQPASLYFWDRATNGLWLGLHNDGQNLLSGELEIELGKLDGGIIERAKVEVSIGPGSSCQWSLDVLLGGFVDANYAYRFGSRAYEIAIATFSMESENESLIEYHLLQERPLYVEQPGSPTIQVEQLSGVNDVHVRLTTDQFIDYLILDIPGAELSDNYFPLLPGKRKSIHITPTNKSEADGVVRAFNSTLQLPLSLSVSG